MENNLQDKAHALQAMIKLSIQALVKEQVGVSPYKSRQQIQQSVTQQVTEGIEGIEQTIKRSISLCQTSLSIEQMQQIFLPIYQTLFSTSADPVQVLPHSQLTSSDYELILGITIDLEQNHAFDDAICVYTLLELLKPEDIRAYIGHALSLEAKGDNIKAAQYYHDMAQALNNPMLNFYAAQFLLKLGQTFEASERLQSAIDALEVVKADSKECADYLIMLQKFKQQHQLH